MQQYLDLARRIIDTGTIVKNKRTGVDCLTVINANMTYDLSDNKIPLVTTRKAPWQLAVAELLGYIRGINDSQAFKDLGAPSWMMNANSNTAWLANPHRKGANDMGYVYGMVGRGFGGHRDDDLGIDQLAKVVNNLSKGIDDRGEIVTFWDPSSFAHGCLRPCMHTHQFSLLGDNLYINSMQRSNDVPLGMTANMIQVAVFARLMAQIVSHALGRKITAAAGYHTLVNNHLYSNQVELMREQLTRIPFASPTLEINPDIRTLWDLENCTLNDFELIGYQHHPAIKYPFTV